MDNKAEPAATSYATHNLNVSRSFFTTLCNAINSASLQERDLYSFRRLVAKILHDPSKPLLSLSLSDLRVFCAGDSLTGDQRLTLRIDTQTNDLLREFREHAEFHLNRPIGVPEALNAIFHVQLRLG